MQRKVLLLRKPCQQVLYSAILFFGYVWILGAILFLALKFAFKSEITLPQVWCTYGEVPAPRRFLKAAAFNNMTY